MLEDIRRCAAAGAHGVVAGCLTDDGAVDTLKTARLLGEAARVGLDFTFHRAFDMSRDLGCARALVCCDGLQMVGSGWVGLVGRSGSEGNLI